MNPAFFQKHWDFLKVDVINTCLVALVDGMLPEFLHDTVVVLIPKKKSHEKVIDLWPIALSNVIYRIIAKMLANRVKGILTELVSETQSTFVLGCLITDNIMAAFEVIHWLMRKR